MAESASAPSPTAASSPRVGSDSRKADSPSTASRAHLTPSSLSTSTFNSLPPLVTTVPVRRASSSRIPSYASRRVSTFSTSSLLRSSRPQSTVFPVFHSHLPYALVRDFAYLPEDPLHYGPPPEAASAPSSTTASEFPRRISDPELIIPHMSAARTPWSGHPDNVDAGMYGGPQLPAMAFGDGPPWREDEDLLSPIVTTARHRKTRSDLDYFSSRSRDVSRSGRRTSYAGRNQDGSQTYYIDHKEETLPGGPGGEFVTLPSSEMQYGPRDATAKAQDSAFGRSYDDSPSASPRYLDPEDHRYSRDYSFSIASPDEEMHGKAIALFDFESENDNELPLIEGQVLWISYRHGQGWLVAKDPATGEDGLVPEAYVRLEREIQGGFGQLNVQIMQDNGGMSGPETPIATTNTAAAAAMAPDFRRSGSPSNGTQQQYPMVSHFSTSSRDLLPQHARTPSSYSQAFGSIEGQMASMNLANAIHSDEKEDDPGSPLDGEITETIPTGVEAGAPASEEASVR